MPYTVNQLAGLTGVTPRTLRHYDNIGLLRPHRAQNGYRSYGEDHVAALQQILFFRESGLELAQIAEIMQGKNFDALQAMERHIHGLQQRRQELDALLDTAQKTLKAMKGEQTMTDQEKFEGFKKELIRENEEKYGSEVREKWGEEAADASNARMMKMTQEQYKAFQALGEELNGTLAKAVATGDPAGELGQKAAALHKDWLCATWPQYSAEAHRNLTQMYVDDERFTAYYEKIAPNAAAFIRDVVALYTKGQD